jgi:hypothetical protein
VAVATGVADDQPLSPGAGNWIYISGVEHLSESGQSIPIFYYNMTLESPIRSTSYDYSMDSVHIALYALISYALIPSVPQHGSKSLPLD